MKDTNSFWLEGLLLLIIALTLITITIHPVAAATLDVGGGDNDHSTIQAAIDNATPGDTIQVYPGTYNENVEVNKQLIITSIDGAAVTSVTATSTTDSVFHVTSDGVTISGFTVSGATADYRSGIYLHSSSDNTLTSNMVSDNSYGIRTYDSNNNVLTSNTLSNNKLFSITLDSSSNNTVASNTVSDNYYGIWMHDSNDNMVTSNVVSDNDQGIYMHSSCDSNMFTNNMISDNTDHGIYVATSSNNMFTNNTASGNNLGIYLVSSSSNTLTNNMVSDNTDYGIYLSSSSDNLIYNNIYNNINNTYFKGTNPDNIWDTTKATGMNIAGGPYLGGNYWLKPDGTGFSQTCVDSDADGICDSNNVLNGNNIDLLPLAEPDTNAPIVAINVPEKDQYYTSSNIWLDATVDKAVDTWWYNINDSGDITFDGDQLLTLPDGSHHISVTCQDLAGNNGSSIVVNFIIDTVAPASVTGLNEFSTGPSSIYWTWTNPTDSDFKHVMVYVDGEFMTNVTGTTYDATDLDGNTEYELQTRTVDSAGNINSIGVNDRASTLDPNADTSSSENEEDETESVEEEDLVRNRAGKYDSSGDSEEDTGLPGFTAGLGIVVLGLVGLAYRRTRK